ncbi:transcription factor bHLH36-like [Abrus precatorius]|uniref:Transcription factor bHLH36-like n=1 Tax=Abrus precatorius TaxID=3816 RepID=A0A8B8K138_ABRPR|nr:transcription factor bHLH36-like [Abrus precatorius]
MDDYVFQFDQTNHCSNVFPLPSCPQKKIISPNLPSHLLLSFGNWRHESSPLLSFDELDRKPGEVKKRKIMHRDVERQRRQEMATLHASLRSLLPVEYLKGTRSISDHMHQAMNYIKHLQKKIEELSNKRDGHKKLCNPSSYHMEKTVENSEAAKQDVVTVRQCWIGVEVVINTEHEEGLPLSRVLQALVREGLRIVNCNSTKVKGRLIHTIESEVSNDGRKMDHSELQQKLTSLSLARFLS